MDSGMEDGLSGGGDGSKNKVAEFSTCNHGLVRSGHRMSE